MKIRITRNVPGLTNMRALVAGDEVDMPSGLAVSLCRDGYAEPVREIPADTRETADVPQDVKPKPTAPAKRAPGRPRKTE